MNAEVDVIATYHTQPVSVHPEIWSKLNAPALDGVLFCASSAAIALENWIDPAEETRFKQCVPAFCIGPSTRQAALRMNYSQVFTAAEQTLPGLVDCITRHI
jgi:uroporphyrinogen-III synthase